jgi:hypothetical protein
VIRAPAILLLLAATPAAARDRYIQPYVELSQVAAADLTNDDVLTYTQLAAGIDAGINTRRAQAQVSYRYERRFDWTDKVADGDVHSGLARAAVKITPALSIEGGALATRARSDIRGAAPGNLVGNIGNSSQVYSAYVGPTLATRAGPFDVGAAYRFGYTRVETPDIPSAVPGQPALDRFSSSKSHMAQASIGAPAGRIAPVGVTLSGAYEREETGQLDQKYEGYYGRGDVVLPVSRTVALRAGAGYEKIEVTQRDPLVDATGNAVTDRNGRFVTDPASPVRIAYDTDGLIYDAGVIWRPSPRLELAANAGWRYGGRTYFGSLHWAMSRESALQALVYDGIETFGRQLRDGLSQLPTSFTERPDPFGQQFSSCVFGAQPGSGAATGGGAGACLSDVFQSISTASYRARGVDAVWSTSRGRTRYGIGLGYANREFRTPRNTPGIVYTGMEDQSAYAQLFYARDLSRVSAIDVSMFGNWYASGLPGAGNVYGAGANGTYTRNFGRLGTLASLGVYGFDQEGFDTQWSAQALLGARYTF